VRLGVLGGSFDPIHLGHLILAETAREQLGLDRVIFVPTGYSWRKAEREMTAATHRCEMVKLAIAHSPEFELSTLEVDREGPSYTAVTLEALADANPGAELFFILGRDALVDLPNWHAPERVVELATLAVATRGDEGGMASSEAALGNLRARIAWLEMPAIEISATDIRQRMRFGRSVRHRVPAEVERYIEAHQLYRSA
jgi:nicotinate-nucleotide adenylyltransferase